jgi:hypothetical protein
MTKNFVRYLELIVVSPGVHLADYLRTGRICMSRYFECSCRFFCRAFFFLVTVFALAACSGLETTLETNNLAGKDFKQYAWESRPLKDVPGAAQMRDADALFEVDHLLRKRIDKAMKQANFVQVPKSRAYLLVDYRLATHTEYSVPGTAAPMDAAERAMDGAAGIDPNNTALYNHPVRDSYRIANLWVTIREAATGELLWQAKAEKTLASNNPDRDEVRKRVDEVITRLFEGFPNKMPEAE